MKTLRDLYAEVREQLLGIPKAAEADGRKDLNEEEQAKVADLLKQAQDLQEKITKADESDRMLKAIGDLPDMQAAAAKMTRDGSKTAQRSARKTPGDLFVESEEYRGLLKQHPNGFSERQRIMMDPVSLGGFARSTAGQKDLVFIGDNDAEGTDSTIPAVVPDFRGIIAPTFAPLSVRQLVGGGTTNSDTVQYVREIRANRNLAAAPVAEARKSSASDDSGDEVKPESTIGFERAETTVRTIAHHIPVTTKALADVGQVRTLIDTFLSRGLDEELEHQLVNGDGTGENLLGLGNDPDLTTVDFTTDLLTTARKAQTALYTLGVQPNAWLMHPEDDEAIDLLKDGVERFYGAGPFGLGPKQLWALPRVWSNQCTKGQAFLGDFSAAVLYDREAATIQTGTIDNQFIRNMLTVLAEMRVAFAVWQPFKIAVVDLGSESS